MGKIDAELADISPYVVVVVAAVLCVAGGVNTYIYMYTNIHLHTHTRGQANYMCVGVQVCATVQVCACVFSARESKITSKAAEKA